MNLFGSVLFCLFAFLSFPFICSGRFVGRWWYFWAVCHAQGRRLAWPFSVRGAGGIIPNQPGVGRDLIQVMGGRVPSMDGPRSLPCCLCLLCKKQAEKMQRNNKSKRLCSYRDWWDGEGGVLHPTPREPSTAAPVPRPITQRTWNTPSPRGDISAFPSWHRWCISAINGWFSFGGKLPTDFCFKHMTVNFVKTLCGSFILCLYCPARESWEC